MTDETEHEFPKRYGPWAIVVGASEGVGESVATQIASRGVDLVLVARSHTLLEQVGERIRKESGVAVRTFVIDLMEPNATDRILAAVSDLEVGLLVYVPGGVHNGDLFLDQPIQLPLKMVALNCAVPVALIHRLTPGMRDRGRGGIILVGSIGCFAGGRHMAAYSAAKAFQVNLAEALWAELDRHGVDVLEAVLGDTSTPARTRTLGTQELYMTPQEVAREMVENIGNGPTRIIGKLQGRFETVEVPWSELRRRAVRVTIEAEAGGSSRAAADHG